MRKFEMEFGITNKWEPGNEQQCAIGMVSEVEAVSMFVIPKSQSPKWNKVPSNILRILSVAQLVHSRSGNWKSSLIGGYHCNFWDRGGMADTLSN